MRGFEVYISAFFWAITGGLCSIVSADISRTQLAGRPLPSFPYFQFVRTVDVGSKLFAAIDTSRFPQLVGTSCRIYVVTAKSVQAWRDDPLLFDVRPGGPQTVSISGAGLQQNTFLVANPGVLSGSAPLGIGVGYDIVLDVDQDGLLDGNDFLDGGGYDAGVYVVADTTQVGPMAVSVLEHSGGPFARHRIHYPANLANMGKLPLVAIGHGWTHGYNFYDHIGSHLASYGYIVTQFSNDVGDGGAAATNTASITTIANTDFIIAAQSKIGGGVLNGHIDASRIIWMGHSTGGEAVVRAHTRLRTGDFIANQFGIDNIVLISSICPVAWHSASQVSPDTVNYHIFIGGADADATGQPSAGYYQSMAIYERGRGNKQLTYVHGAGHNDFHEADQIPLASGPALIGKTATNAIVRGYTLPLVELYARNNPAAKDFFMRPYEDFHPLGIPANVVIANEYKDTAANSNFVIDDFQTQANIAVSSSDQSVGFNVMNVAEILMRDQDNSLAWTGVQSSNGMTRYRAVGDDPNCVTFDWSSPSYYELTIAPEQRNLSDREDLSFRACQGTRHPNTNSLNAALSFSVTLRDAANISTTISIANYGRLTQPYQRTGFGAGAGWGNEFKTFRIRLTDFVANGSGINLTNVVAVRFEFGGAAGSAIGRIGLDDIQLTTAEPTPSPSLEIDIPDGLPGLHAPGNPMVLLFRVKAVGQQIVEGSPGLFWRVDDGGFASIPTTQISDDLFEATLPVLPCGNELQLYLQATGNMTGIITEPRNAPARFHRVRLGEQVMSFNEPLNRDPGWVRSGQWEFGAPLGSGGGTFGNPDPTSGATGQNVYGVNLNGNYSSSPSGPHYLQLGPINLTNVHSTMLSFQRWLNTDVEPWIKSTVDVSPDGSTWTTVWSTWDGPFINESQFVDSAWTPLEIDISSVADNQPFVYIRWGYRIISATTGMSGWNIDDIAIHGLQTAACQCITMPGDVSGDSSLDVDDIQPFVACVLSGPAILPECVCADVAEDGQLDGHDVISFVEEILTP